MNTFPWERAMEIGLGMLRLGPRAFWAMTLPELAAAARGAGLGGDTRVTMSRAQFTALSDIFPDC